MLTPTEREEIRQIVDAELADIEDQCAHAGSYKYLCQVGRYGRILTHAPVGRILRCIHHPHDEDHPADAEAAGAA